MKVIDVVAAVLVVVGALKVSAGNVPSIGHGSSRPTSPRATESFT